MTQTTTDTKLANFGTYGLHVIQFPSGRYGFVGTVPEELATPSSYPTQEDAIAAFTTWDTERKMIYRKPLEDMYDVRLANAQAGHHFFERGALRFFGSRIGRTLYGNRYFVTSEQRESYTERRYTVREVTPAGHISTVGTFMQYPTTSTAKAAIMDLINGCGITPVER